MIIAYWSYLESTTEVALWALLKVPRETGVIFTTHMNQTARCEALAMLVARDFKDADELFKKTLKHIDEAQLKRNMYVHALWKHQKKEGKSAELLKISARKKFKQESKQIYIKEMRSLVKEIHDLTISLQVFVEVAAPNFKVPW